MRVQLKKSSYGILSFIALTILISACGKSNKMAQFVPAPQGTQTVIPTLDPFANGQVSSVTNPIVASLNVVAAPSQSANVGQVIYLFVYGSSSNSYNFQFSTNSIGASFVGSTTGVQQVGVTSSGAGSVTVTVTTAAGSYSSGSITLNFTGSTSTPVTSPYSSCSIQGPYEISNYYSYGSAAYPQVGGSYYFSVQTNSPYTGWMGAQEQLKIINVWTLDPTETGRYYNSWSQFWMTFNSAGSKTIYVRAQSQTTGTTCDAQITINVSGGGYYPNPTTGTVGCGMLPATGLGYCSQVVTYSYYFDGVQCRQNMETNSCAAKGPFASMADCQQAVAAGRCGGSSGGSPVARQVYVDSRSTQWVDTGIDVSPSSAGYASSLTVTTSGQVNYGQGYYSSADGVGTTGYHRCKASDGQNFKNVALIGKIGVNGTPFLVGSSLSTSVNYSTGRLYLIVNDPGCASDNSGSFVANINFQRVPLVY